MSAGRYLDRLKDFLESGTTKAKIATVLLCVIAVASIPIFVVGAGAMGNAIQMFGRNKRYSKKQIRSAMQSIKKQKLIEYVEEKNGKTVVKITKKGKARLRAFSIDLIRIKEPKRWDRKWRLVIFDIPIRFKRGREALRYHLKDLNFLQFQKSAWIYPYPCEDEIIFISDFYGLGNHVEILTIESMLHASKARAHFKLPPV